MHDDMQYDPKQGQGECHEPFKSGNPAIFNSYILYLVRHLQRELETDHGFLNWGTISKFDGAGCLIFGLVFMSRDFKVGRNVTCEESTVSPVGANLFNFAPIISLELAKLGISNFAC